MYQTFVLFMIIFYTKVDRIGITDLLVSNRFLSNSNLPKSRRIKSCLIFKKVIEVRLVFKSKNITDFSYVPVGMFKQRLSFSSKPFKNMISGSTQKLWVSETQIAEK
jgi:hypothetical protein